MLNVRPEVSAWLAELAEHYELVWCTTWSNANSAIAPLLGLAELDQVPFPETWEDVPLDLCRKTEHVRLWAAGRDPMPDRLAWVDDEVTQEDRVALARSWTQTPMKRRWEAAFAYTAPIRDVLAITTEPTLGLTRAQVDELLAWV